jgi:sulfate adenylyltransferase
MKQIDYESVLDRMVLESGYLWPVPVCLDVGHNFALSLETGQLIA